VIKSIVFEDVILIKRYVWKDITIGYEEIEHITFANLKAGRKNIVLQEILNLNELLHIFEEKIAEGKITIDNTKNQQIANKQYIRMSVGAMLFLLLVIIEWISTILPNHFLNSIIDGFIVWFIIAMITLYIIDKKEF